MVAMIIEYVMTFFFFFGLIVCISHIFCSSQSSVIQSNPYSAANVVKETAFQEALQEQLLREEVLWKQKFKELWLTCTDLNTKFFHASTVCRRRYNSISSSKNLDGSVIIGRDNIGSLLVNHFSSLFSTINPIQDDGLAELVDVVITEDKNVALCILPDKVEIFSAIFYLGLNKAPGPDGILVCFIVLLADCEMFCCCFDSIFFHRRLYVKGIQSY
jgi:hypothetical protein